MLRVKKTNIMALKVLINKLKKIYTKNYIWLLYGEIGSGKTTFIQYLLNIPITSPSFMGYKVYDKILHIDTYYTKNLPIFLIQEYYDEEYNIFIEWPLYEHLLIYYNCISIYIDKHYYYIFDGIYDIRLLIYILISILIIL